jgi:hypothetical protein
MLRIVKRKATGFFKPGDISVIRQAVGDVHRIISDASCLVRAYYLREYDDGIVDTSGVDTVKPLVIDHQLLKFACSIVQGVAQAPLRKSRSEHADAKSLYGKTQRGLDGHHITD